MGIGHLRRAIQIPSAAHSALEYQRWAVRGQLRSEGRRFIRSRLSFEVVAARHRALYEELAGAGGDGAWEAAG